MRLGFFRTLRYLLEYAAVIPVYHFVRVLPHSLLFKLSKILGACFFLLPPINRLIIANLKIAFPEKSFREINRIGRNSASNLILAMLEFFWFKNRPDMLEKYIDFNENTRRIADECRYNGRGLIWVTPHLGNWELGGLRFRHGTGIPFAVVVRPLNNPFLNSIIFSARESEGNRIISAKGSVKEMIKALKEGFFFATLIDQNTRARDGGIFVDFFGLPVSVSRAPAMFARKLDVGVAVGGCSRKGERYDLFGIDLSKKTRDFSSDEELIRDIMRINENLIRKYPEQYLWLYKRWQYIPEGLEEAKIKRYPYYAEKVTPRFFSNKAPKT